MVFEEERDPGVGGELVVVHAREGVGVVEVGAVALVQLEQRVGHASEDLAAAQGDLRVAQGRNLGAVVQPGLQAVVLRRALHQGGDAGREVECHDGIVRAHVLLVEGRAVDLLVLREAQPHVHRGVRHRARAAAVGAHHRHVAIAVDALPAGPHGGREAVQPFVLVVRLAAVDRREAPVAAREDRGKNIVVGERIVAGAQLQHVVLPREGQLAREPATEDQLDRAAALHPLVARAVGHVAPQADAAADLRGSAPAQLHAEPLETVEARRLEVGADADVFRVPVARQEGVDDRVDVAVERHLLHAVDHGVDAPFAVGEAVGAHLLPVGVVVPLRLGLVHHYLVVGAEHLRGQRLADAHVGIDHLARADERDHARRVARGDRELGRRTVAAPEPETVARWRSAVASEIIAGR